jgi:hypothetical protein
MRCPKCQFDHQLQTTECLKCGIIFSRYRPALESAAKPSATPAAVVTLLPLKLDEALTQAVDDSLENTRSGAIRELKYRILAMPLALLFARLLAHTPLALGAGMLTMVLHESGHAITAWLTGRWAVPLLWVTMHGDHRSWLIVFGLAAAIISCGVLAWRAERWGWVLIAVAALIVQLMFLSLPAESSIVFGGDGGALVLSTILMAAFYAPRESKLERSWGLRWGLLVIGALVLVHVSLLWSGPMEDLPFGEIEGVNLSDPSLLTEMYGWTVLRLVDRYVRLAKVCLAFLAILYLSGLISAYLQLRRTPPPNPFPLP